MIKKIQAGQLQPGMYIHDLNCDWMTHPFARNKFLLKDAGDIDKIRAAAIPEVYIDTDKGLDVADAPTESEVRAETEHRMLELAAAPAPAPVKVSAADELVRAQRIHEQAGRVVRNVMNDARLGRAVQVADIEAVVTDITASVARNSGALLSLLRLKDADDYTYMHCVAVGTMMVTFARHLELDAETVRQAGIGGLMHDVGKMKIPDQVLNKPGKLTDEEFAVIRRHPEEGHAILVASGAVGEIPLDITLHHHERIDGSGYPHKLPADRISTLAKMSAIVDVYDAITSDRVYHKGMAPTEALRKMFEWSKFHFEEKLVHHFMRCIGIYPVGTLVLLESGRLGVVTDQTEGNLLAPRVRTFFSTRANCYVKPEEVDLARGADRIVSHEPPEKWGVDPMRFLKAA
ncbi:MAG: HD-GYP domain-containing protein [Burkholderiales bacterium]|nr:HD-GYP domain-containing protein [Burkholderiales bacterium]